MLSTTESLMFALPWLGGPLIVAAFFTVAGLTVIRRADRRAGLATAAAGGLVLGRALASLASTLLWLRLADWGELGSRIVLLQIVVRNAVSWGLIALSVTLTLYAAVRLARAIRVEEGRQAP